MRSLRRKSMSLENCRICIPARTSIGKVSTALSRINLARKSRLPIKRIAGFSKATMGPLLNAFIFYVSESAVAIRHPRQRAPNSSATNRQGLELFPFVTVATCDCDFLGHCSDCRFYFLYRQTFHIGGTRCTTSFDLRPFAGLLAR